MFDYIDAIENANVRSLVLPRANVLFCHSDSNVHLYLPCHSFVVGNKIHETTTKQCRALLRNAIIIVYAPAVRLILC
jgi:hypothetical protein